MDFVGLDRWNVGKLTVLGEATKDAEIGNIGFLLLPSDVGNATIESRGRRAIGDVDIGGDGEIPE